jgi:hypothetical protein
MQWVSSINLAVTTLIAIGTAYSSCALNGADARLKAVESEVKKREADRQDLEANRAARESLEKKEFTIYEAVIKSLETSDSKRQGVAKALVTSMLEVDQPLRAELLAVLVESGTPTIQKDAKLTLAKENAFREQTHTVNDTTKSATFRYDIFWCESSGEDAKRTADDIKAKLGQDRAVRVRLLPNSINARVGYQVTGYVIRLNKGEDQAADELAKAGDSALGQPNTFTKSPSLLSTPNYVSAFVCPPA